MALRLVTSAAAEPVTLEEVKAFLRVDTSDEDAIITELAQAARALLDGPNGILNRCLVSQTWDLFLDAFPMACWPIGTDAIQLPLAPVRSVSSVTYYDGDGNLQTLSTSAYFVDTASTPAWVVPGLDGWPSTLDAANVVTIRFVAGYPPTLDSPPDLVANIPPPLKLALKMLASYWFDNRESAGTLPSAVGSLVLPFRVIL